MVIHGDDLKMFFGLFQFQLKFFLTLKSLISLKSFKNATDVADGMFSLLINPRFTFTRFFVRHFCYPFFEQMELP